MASVPTLPIIFLSYDTYHETFLYHEKLDENAVTFQSEH